MFCCAQTVDSVRWQCSSYRYIYVHYSLVSFCDAAFSHHTISPFCLHIHALHCEHDVHLSLMSAGNLVEVIFGIAPLHDPLTIYSYAPVYILSYIASCYCRLFLLFFSRDNSIDIATRLQAERPRTLVRFPTKKIDIFLLCKVPSLALGSNPCPTHGVLGSSFFRGKTTGARS